MKTYLISLVIALIIGGFIAWSLHPDDKSQEVIAQYQQRVKEVQDSLAQVIKTKQQEIDSLKSLEPKIIIKYKDKQHFIDSTIAKDSTNSIKEYRNGLLTLNVIPDSSKDLTFREIGFGAKFFNKLQESIDLILLKDQINDKQSLMIKQLQQKADILYEENELLKLKECEEPSFWYKRFPVIIGTGIGYDVDRKIIIPTVGIYIGIRIN